MGGRGEKRRETTNRPGRRSPLPNGGTIGRARCGGPFLGDVDPAWASRGRRAGPLPLGLDRRPGVRFVNPYRCVARLPWAARPPSRQRTGASRASDPATLLGRRSVRMLFWGAGATRQITRPPCRGGPTPHSCLVQLRLQPRNESNRWSPPQRSNVNRGNARTNKERKIRTVRGARY